MNCLRTTLRSAARPWLAAAITLLGAVSLLPAQGQRPPALPPGCEDLQVPAGHQVSLHLYAQGYQIYQWSTTTNRWEFRGPTAFLYADPWYGMAIGLHFGGPRWLLNSGTMVRGEFDAGVTVDPTAIPWLKLRAAESTGPGLLERTTYIQRLNTVGGNAPDRVGSPNETVWIPYTAEYWFYRAL